MNAEEMATTEGGSLFWKIIKDVIDGTITIFV